MTKPIPELSDSRELADLPPWDRCFWLSRAFLEGGRILCQQMLQEDFTSQYSSSRVILHLVRQGIELFLKAAIGRATPDGSMPLTHDLSRLLRVYKEHYPQARFDLAIPARFGASLNLPLFGEDDHALHSTLDQRYRYASDRSGNSFATPEVFDAVEVMGEIEVLDRELKVLEWGQIRRRVAG